MVEAGIPEFTITLMKGDCIMTFKRWAGLTALGIGGILLAAATAFAQPGDPYLPGGSDLKLPYYNDAKEQTSFRGGEDFNIAGGKPGTISTSLIRSGDGTLYYTDSDGIRASSPEGKILWSYNLPTPSGLKYAALGADGTVYAFEGGDSYYKTKGAVFAFNQDGTVKWTYELKDIESLEFSRFAGDANGNFIFETKEGIVSLSPSGTVNWTNTGILRKVNQSDDFTFTNISSLIPDSRGNIVVDTFEGIYLLDGSGKLQWKNDSSGSVYVSGDRIFALAAEGLHSYDIASGKELQVNPEEIPLDSALPTDHESGYYISVENGIAKIDGTGNKLWTYEIRESGYRSAYGLVSDVDGNVYFTNNGGSVYSLDKNGRERFILYIQNHSSDGSDIATDSAGNAYILSRATGLARVTPKDKEIRIRLDNQEVFLPSHPVVKNGNTLLPMRKLFEMLGSSVTWDQETQTATAKKGDTTLSVTVGSTTATINGSPAALDEAPIVSQGSTMVPMRFIAEALGYSVHWDGSLRLIQLTGPGKKPESTTAAGTFKTLLSDANQRFYVVAGNNWQGSTAAGKDLRATEPSKEWYMIIGSIAKADLKDHAQLSDVQELVEVTLDRNLTDSDISAGASLTLGKLKALQFEAEGVSSNFKIHFLMTVIEGADRYYIVQQWAVPSKFKEALPEFEEIVKSFRIMDSTPPSSSGSSTVSVTI